MSNILLLVVLGIVIILAMFTVVSNDLFKAIIYSGVLSLFTAFLYILLGAPDVALAEAVIGATVVTVIFLVTLKKYRIFNIYLSDIKDDTADMEIIRKVVKALRAKEIEVHVLQVSRTPEELLSHHNCDLVVHKKEKVLVLVGEKGNQHLREIEEVLVEEVKNCTVSIEENE